MQKVNILKAIIFTSSVHDTLNFVLEEGVLIIAISEYSKKAFGLILPKEEVETSDLYNDFFDQIRQNANEGIQFKHKIIGPSSLKKKIEDRFSSKIDFEFIIREGVQEYIYETGTGRIRASEIKKSNHKKIKVLIVDDSKTMCHLLMKMMQDDSIEVIGAIQNPFEVDDFIEKNKPDVITLDVYMEGMDGLTLLKKIFPKYRLPIVMISSINITEGQIILQALENGAVDYIQKPDFNHIESAKELVIEKIKTAYLANLHEKLSTNRYIKKIGRKNTFSSETIIFIGASTGGTEAIRCILEAMPESIPPILIVQHIPPIFSKSFADRLNKNLPFEVIEAEDGSEVKNNRVIIAPGGKQMELSKVGANFVVKLSDFDEGRHKPCINVLFKSAVKFEKYKAIGLILTGMGNDGAEGLEALHKWGAKTIAQDESSSVVFGMPKEAIKLNCVDEICSLENIADKIISWLG